MTFTLDLTPETVARLEEEATKEGVGVQDLARRLIETALPATPAPMTGAEAIAFWEKEGVRGVYADREDSPALARELRRQEETRGRDAA